MPRNTLPRRLLSAVLLLAVGMAPAIAEKRGLPKTRPASCPAPVEPALPASSFTGTEADDGRVHVIADEADAKLDETLSFRGHVELRRGPLQVFADELLFNQADNTLSASGQVQLNKMDGEAIRSAQLHYEIDTERGDTQNAEFALPDGQGRGRAGRVFFVGRDALTFEKVRYTTCPAGQDDWFLHAGELTLDKARETGSAWNAWVEFMHVPIFYSPYLTFPIGDERKSGFLPPRFGHHSQAGFFVLVPYYFNLAPNYDDTLTPRFLSERGLQLLNEFRYLGARQGGQLDLQVLPSDRVTRDDRWAGFWRHRQNFSPLWSGSTDVQWVSDNNYFIDLGTTTNESSRTHLPRFARLDYGGSIWRFATLVSNYQTIDTTIPVADQPYQRLPQFILRGSAPYGPNRLQYSLDSELTHFYRQASVTGQRFDILPGVSWPLRTPYFYFTPKAGYRYTAWHLDNTLGDETPERTLPIYSVDSGLFLERDDSWFGTRLHQTLEPRVYYVNIPYRNQDDLPVFDSAIPDFSFLNFFRENRFVGADRVGDANQLTAAVTSRFLQAENGAERARISLGQVLYFENRRVNLPAGTVTQTSSDMIAEAYARLDQPWYLRSDMQWDNEARETRKFNFYLHYRPKPDRIVNLGYRLLNAPAPGAEDEQFDVSAQWPLTVHWALTGRWNYSIPDSRTLQAYAGVGYSDCCWTVRLAARHRLRLDGTEDDSVLLELELSGLSRLGQSGGDENPLKRGQFIFE